jgi:hypothetical protein
MWSRGHAAVLDDHERVVLVGGECGLEGAVRRFVQKASVLKGRSHRC